MTEKSLRQRARHLAGWMVHTVVPAAQAAWDDFADKVCDRSDDAGALTFLNNSIYTDGVIDDKKYDQTFEACCRIVDGLESNVKAIDAEIKRLQDAKKANKESIDWLYDAMAAVLQSTGHHRVVTPLGYSVVRVKSKAALELRDESAIPDGFFRVKREPDRVAIRAALEAGKDVDGAFLVEKPDGVTIRRGPAKNLTADWTEEELATYGKDNA